MSDGPRYAIYFAPIAGLAQFGAEWLGHDLETGNHTPQMSMAHLPRPLSEITEAPRKYGLHATLKAPFHLADGYEPADLIAAARTVADGCPALTVPMRISTLADTVVLSPVAPSPRLTVLAAQCVQDLDHLRAPPSEDYLRRRRAAGLGQRQERLLQRWGYPYVLDEFRFHMTLTGSLSTNEQLAVMDALGPLLAPFGVRSTWITQIAVVVEQPDGRFRILERIPLRG